MAVEPKPCPKCSGPVTILPSSGGMKDEMTMYLANCKKCGVLADDIGSDGTKRSATREWNRYVKQLPSDSNSNPKG